MNLKSPQDCRRSEIPRHLNNHRNQRRHLVSQDPRNKPPEFRRNQDLHLRNLESQNTKKVLNQRIQGVNLQHIKSHLLLPIKTKFYLRLRSTSPRNNFPKSARTHIIHQVTPAKQGTSDTKPLTRR